MINDRQRVSARCRGTVPMIALCVGFLLMPASDAGLFEKFRAKRQAKVEMQKKPAAKPRPRPAPRSNYRDAHGDAYINQDLLDVETEAARKVVIDIGRQRAFLVVNDLIAIDTAVSTARRGKYTPRGTFQITEKVKSGKVSTIYHVYMPNWMRLGQTTIGMHTGDLPGYPASAGCIRLPQSVAPVIYEHVSRGVTVEVVDSWDESGLKIPYLRPQGDMLAAL